MQFLTVLYLVITIVWAFLSFKTYWHETHQLQRGLLVIPAFKCLMSLIQLTYVSQCPWQDSVQYKYILMALVSIITLYQTIHACIIILIAKGWKYIRSSLTKDDLSSVTLMMAFVYLSNSAYFVTATIDKM